MIESASATAEGHTVVYIDLDEEGDYWLTANPANTEATGTQQHEQTYWRSPDCKGVGGDETSSSTDIYTYPLHSLDVHGVMDPENPEVLTGSQTTVEEVGDAVVTTTLTWDLERSGAP